MNSKNRLHPIWQTLKRGRLVLLAVFLFLSAAAIFSVAATSSSRQIWKKLTASFVAAPAPVGPAVQAAATQHNFQLQTADVARMVAGAPLEASGIRAAQSPAVLTLPHPDGTPRRYRVLESPIIAPELAAKFPDIKSYTAQGVEDPSATARFSWTSRGLHGLILGNDYSVYIHPVDHTTTTNYVSYYGQQDDQFECGVTDDTPGMRARASQPGVNIKNGGTLRVYRWAIATPGEYTMNPAYGGGSVAGTVASLNIWVNQVNAGYEREAAIRFTLVNNTSIIYTDAATDPFTNPTSTSIALTEIRDVLRTVVGVANYDLGHVLLVGDTGGLAYGSVVCDSSGLANKGGGASGVTLPLGSAYGSSRLMHETAHQFGVSHTFNDGETNGCASNRAQATSYESGSGLSIMSYPHICLKISSTGTNGRVLFFHNGSLAQMMNYVAGRGGTCGTTALTGNTPPTVSAGPDRTIPRNTPFTLTATGSDPDVNDAAALTWAWEQIDSGNSLYFQTSNPASFKDAGDPSTTTRPIFRPFAPTPNPARTFPSLTYILNNANVPPDQVGGLWTAEHLPNITRQINFRVTLRDNRAGSGAFADDHVVLNVDGNSGPFLVTAPNTATSLPAGSMQTVTWNVNNTNLAPVNCANVKISLSTDGGQTFPTVLAASTPNDGSEVITLPALASTIATARIKVEAADNIFFDISDANFTIASGVSCPAVTSFAPAAGNTGTSVKIFGTGLTSVTAVKFSNNVTATFTVNNDNQITVTQPAGAVSGPITISKAGCADTVTTAYIVCPAAAATLSVDDNGFEQMTSARYVVNRLTPASYPATLQSVSIRIESTQNLQLNTPFILLYGVNADGDADINNTSFQTMNATVSTLGSFVKYDLPQPITIQSGDFVVGYNFPNGGQTALLDTSAPQGRSYSSSDGLNFTTNITPNNTQANLFIRAGILTGCGLDAAACPTVGGISPLSGQIGDTVTITGTGFSGASGVKFNNNIIANFTIVSDTQITATVPPGTTSGAITISEPNCSDALTASFTVNAPICMAVSGFSPATALPGVPITITGTNFTGVSVVKFSNDQAAAFTVDSDTQITAIVPPGAGFGPITISKQGCADVQTANFTPCNTSLPLQIDDGSSNSNSGYAGPITLYLVSRLTPAVYPATLTTVQFSFASTSVPVGTAVSALAAANPSGSSTINGLSFQTTAATTGATGQFASVTLTTPLTINTGDFVVGVSISIPSGSTWFVESRDTDNPQGRSYRSSNAGSTFTLASGNANYLIRGVYQRPCCSGLTVAVNPTNTVLPGALLGTPYSQTFTQTGGAGAATWSLSAGTLPAGLTLNPATGALTGTPTAIGTSSFTIRATDQNNCTGEQAYTLAVTCPVIAVSPGSLPDGTVGTAYNQTLSALPSGSYSFGVTGGTLPAGLTLDGSGNLTGTPTQSGVFNFTVTATSAGGACTGTRTYAVTIGCPAISINPSSLPDGTVGVAYSQTLTSAALSGAYTFALTGGALPTGLSLAANGTLSGTPSTTTGSPFSFTITATHTDSGCTGSQSYVVNVACPTITLNPATLPDATVSDVYNQTITASPAGSYTFVVTGGALPTGTNLTSGGVLSGTTSAVGVFSFTVTATGAGGCTGQQSYTVTVASPYCAPPPANLTSWWKAEGNASDVNNANNGTLSGSVTFAAGKVGRAFSFNGTNGYVLLPGSAFPTAQPGGGSLPFTFELWFKTASSGVIMGQEDTLPYTSPNNLLASIWVGTNGKLYTRMFCCGGSIPSAATVNDNVFHHVAVVFDGTTETSYLDGSVFSSLPYTQIGISTFFTLGVGDTAGGPSSVPGWWNFTGLIDEPTVYNRALTATEIQSLVSAGSRGKCEDCVPPPANLTSWWKAENTASDATNANNGTLQGSATFAAGKVNQAFSFNGTNGYVHLPDNFFPVPNTGLGNTPFTFELWFKTSTSGVIFGQQTGVPYGTLSGGYTPAIYVGTNGKLHVLLTDDGTQNPIITTASVNDGVFHHVAVVYNGTTEVVYLDGTVSGSKSLTIVGYANPYNYQFGTGYADSLNWENSPAGSGWWNFNGLIDEPTLYSRALTAGEVLSIVNAGSAGKCCAIAIAQTTLPDGTLGISYNQTITAGGNVGAVSFTSSGTLPPGLTLSAGGVLSGTPTQSGLFNFTVTATDAASCSASQAFTVAVNCPAISFSPSLLPVALVGTAYNQTITAGPGSYNHEVTAGALPAGVTLASGGALSGIPAQTGIFTFTVTATNLVGGCSANQIYQLQVDCPIIALTPANLPDGTVGAAYNQTITPSGLAGAYVFALDDGALPTGLTLNPATGQLSGTLTAGGTFGFVVSATHTVSGCRGSQAFSITAACPTINITPTTLPAGFVGMTYNQSLTAGGGTPAYTFALASGSLPAGLSLGANGAVTGTPSLPGAYNFTVAATDNYGCVGTANISLTIGGCQTIVVTPPAVNTGTLGIAYSQTFTQSGGQGATIFSTPGPLPAGMTLSTGGVLSGTPGQVGVFPITVTATDSFNCTGTTNFTLTINCPTITLSALTGGTAGTAYSQTLTASPSGGGYTFAVTAGSLPPGLTLASGGALTGTPTQAGTFNFTATATGFGSCTGSQAYTIVIACPAIALSPASLPNPTGGMAYSQSITAAPGGTAYSFAVTNGALPAGLTLASNGTLSGTTTQSGVFNFRVTANGFGACSGFRDYTLTISGCSAVTVDPATLPGGTVGTAYNQTVSGNPAGTYSYSVTAGALPTGLTLNAGTGAITGTPSQRGTYNFTVTATSGGCSGTRAYSVVIGCPGLTVSSLPSGVIGTAYNSGINVNPAGSYTYSVSAGSLPAGLTLNTSTGSVSGTPTTAGSSTFTIRITASGGCVYGANYTVVINCPTITLSALPTPALNSAYNQTISAAPAGGNYSFAVTAGALPAGLSLNQLTGVVSGTPTAAGTFNFTVTATGFSSCSGSRAYSFTISAGTCPSITLAALPGGSVGHLYNLAVTASPSGTYNYLVTAGSLPPGLTLYNSFGLINGYPTVEGTYTFTITATDASNCTGQRAYSVVIGGALRPSVLNDFTGDRRTDFTLWRAEQRQWLIVDSETSAAQTVQWGQADDQAVTGDFDGDGKADLAAFGKDGHWRVKLSRDGATLDKLWGLGSDVPVPGDYDGDGKTDPAVWRGTESGWYIQRSSDRTVETVQWGSSLAPYFDVPVPGDYDGDGKTDIAVFRQSNGHWYIKRSSDGQTVDKVWGLGTDAAVPGDYDGDGKTDIAVWRGSVGAWYIVRSSDGAVESKVWGAAYGPYFDAPAAGDYDGDGKADIAIWRRSEGRWYIVQSSNGETREVTQGRAGDKPVGGR